MDEIDISILIPTKKRIFNIKNVIHTIFITANQKEKIEIIFYVDSDDNESQNHIDSYNNKNIRWVTTQKKVLFSDMWNYCYKDSKGKYLMLCGDDVTFQTANWDMVVKEIFLSYKDRIVYVVPYDGHANGNLGVHGFLSKEWINVVGYFTPPYFSYWYVDTWIDEISRKINRFHYLPEIKIIHNHWESPNRTFIDNLYIENKNKVNQQLHDLWNEKATERAEQVNKLLKYIGSKKEKI
jgi:hypothetical protein